MSRLVIVFSCHVKSCLVFGYADCGDADDAVEDDDVDDDDDVDNEGCGNRDLHVTPTTVKSGDPVVTLDSFPALGAFPCCVSLHLAKIFFLQCDLYKKNSDRGEAYLWYLSFTTSATLRITFFLLPISWILS